MSVEGLREKVFGTMSREQLTSLKDGWEVRREASIAEGNARATLISERMIELYREQIDQLPEGNEHDHSN